MILHKKTYKYISNYLNKIRSRGRYSVTLIELREQFDVSEKALLQNLYRLKSNNRIAQIRRGFYVIIPPQYSHRGMLPTPLFIDDMMKFLNKKYYVGFLSAAAIHGATHQQLMAYQVVTKKPSLRDIQSRELVISFFTKSDWDEDTIIQKKTEVGYMNVSSPELTALDLVYYSRKVGGVNRLIPVLEDLSNAIKPSKLNQVAKNCQTPVVQRLGYLLREIGCESPSLSLWKIIERKNLKAVPLSLAHSDLKGELDEKWKVYVNTALDL